MYVFFHRRRALENIVQALVRLLQQVLKRGQLLYVSLWDVAELRVERRRGLDLRSGVQEVQIFVASVFQNIHRVFHRDQHLRLPEVLLDGTNTSSQSVTQLHECLGWEFRW